MPKPPFYVIDQCHGRCLELGGDGSYAACQALLRELEAVFGARCAIELDAGALPDSDKEKGYWNVEMFGQKFLVMRVRGDGMCLWGPKSPVDIAGFLRVAEHFGATEQTSRLNRILRWLGPLGR